ncbi:MAG TPA: hypothetical protein ENI12_02070 [Nitrospirae bacterium]|nr:hypothetical protein [Nitrospirota bacterium]
MTKRLVILLLVAVLLASSCATRRETVPPIAEDQQKSKEQDAFALPPVEEEKKAAKAAKGKRDAQAILAQMDKDEEYLILNFENTDIKTIVSTFAELLEFNYILAPGVGGSVTIQSYKRIPTKDLFQIFQSILEINGLTAVQVGKFYHIIPIDQARTYPLDVETSKEVDFTLDGSFITQLIPLEHVSASDVANNIIRQLMPRGVHLIVYEPANTLVLTARPETLAKFMRIIEAIDITEGERHTLKTFVYYVENGSAKKLQDILKTIYVSKSTAKSTAPARTTPTTRVRPTATRKPAVSQAALPADLGDITITAYEDINALIIKASPRSYLGLLEVLKKIDVPPKQVLIDVMIAEISLSDSMQFGFEWFMRSQSGNLAGVNYGGLGEGASLTLPPTVPNPATGFFSYAAAGTMGSNEFNALFTALETYSDVNVLASPSILAMDNKEAQIKIGSEEPVATRRSSSGVAGTDLDIQYKTIGTLLSVTPHITEKGKVSMEISVEQSGIGGEQNVGGQIYPSFTTRVAKTTAVIEDGKTLVLGGIIYERGGSSRSGVPFLSRIPIIGALFGSHTYFNDKAELIIMVTPHVISNSEDAMELTRQYQNRVKIIKEKIDFLRAGPDDDKNDPKDKKDDEEDGDESTSGGGAASGGGLDP